MAKRKRPEEEEALEEEESEECEEEEEEEEEDGEGDESELDINVDDNGRICSTEGPLTRSMCLDPPVRVFDGILPIEHLDALKECCRTFFQAKPSRGRYSSGKTFWSEWNQAPRCELEALALAILHQHCPSPAANAGVEWWTLCLDESSEVAWHWDRDYSLERSGVNVHPMLGTVTYLSQGEDSDSAQLSTLTLDVLSSVQRTGEDVMLPPSGGSAWCTVVPPRYG
ncbi:Uncharacterized protein SCF082_LOCUS49873 [Durusdinium trenchii]|uniref:Uncharacterized protein n=1 Tax=Durusdinium trenchii TaxID=1381693 RepID=A0ABP0S448_9DINO